MKTLIELTMQGVINFEDSFRLRMTLIKEVLNNKELIEEVVNAIPLNEEILSFIKENSSSCYIVTGAVPDYIFPLFQKIPCQFITSQGFFNENSYYQLSKIMDKGEAIRNLRRITEKDMTIIAIGDGANDAPMFEEADISIAFGGVTPISPTLYPITDYFTYTQEILCHLLKML